MNLNNSSLHLHEGSESEAQELADEPPIWNHHQSHSRYSPLLKALAIGVSFLAQLPGVFSSSVTRQLDLSERMPLLESRHTISHGVTQELNRHSTSPLSIILIPILVLASGLFAGLTIGYMSLDTTQLAVLAKSGTPVQRRLAQKVAPLRKNGHMLLITLLIANMIANETLPIVSEKALGGGIQAIIISTVLVIIFSEIIPQSVCATHALRIGAAFAKPVQMLVYFFYPIVWPISWLLTKLLGDHAGTIYRPAELKELINIHARHSNNGGDLASDVVTIIGSAIDLQERVVEESMTLLNNCFMLDIDTQLNYETMSDILASGHSRIPIYETVMLPSGPSRRIVGALLTKQLILIDPEDGVLLREFPLNPLPHVASDMPLLNILNSFQEGRSHLAVVCPSLNTLADVDLGKTAIDQPMGKSAADKSPWWQTMWNQKTNPSRQSLTEIRQLDALNSSLAIQPSKELLTDQPLGIISLEDVLEALLNEPIYDETDLDEHGHMAVPPYVPPEAFAALRKPYSVPSPLYDSKALHHVSSHDAVRFETETIFNSTFARSPDTSKTLQSSQLFQAYESASPVFTNSGDSCNSQLIGSLSKMTHSNDAINLAPVCQSSEVASEKLEAIQIPLRQEQNSHTGQPSSTTGVSPTNLSSHVSGTSGASLTLDWNSLILHSIDDKHLDASGAILRQSNGHTSAINAKELVHGNQTKDNSIPSPDEDKSQFGMFQNGDNSSI